MSPADIIAEVRTELHHIANGNSTGWGDPLSRKNTKILSGLNKYGKEHPKATLAEALSFFKGLSALKKEYEATTNFLSKENPLPDGWIKDAANLQNMAGALDYCRNELFSKKTPMDRASLDALVEHLASRGRPSEIVEFILDLHTGPRSFARSQDNPNQANVVSLDQNVFLNKEQKAKDYAPGKRAGQVDEFANGIARKPNKDGVYCLAGDRGSGKSTILNRIAHNCEEGVSAVGAGAEGVDKESIEEEGVGIEGTKPLLVRVDLSVAFDSRRFMIDLTSLICQTVRSRLDINSRGQTSTSLPQSLGMVIQQVAGGIGHWCLSNLRWSIVVALVLVMSYGIYKNSQNQAGGVASSSANKQNTANQSKAHETTTTSADDPGEEKKELDKKSRKGGYWYCQEALFFSVVLFLVLVAAAHWRRLDMIRRGASQAKPWNASNSEADGQRRIFLVGLLMLCGLGASVWVVVQKIYMLDVAVEYNVYLFTLPAIAYLCFVNLTLPKYWDLNTYATSILECLKEEKKQAGTPNSLLGKVGDLVEQVLPSAKGDGDLSKATVPFLQLSMKEVLEKSVNYFPYVVILIDDLDVMSSEHYHEILRILRPITKVKRVRCVFAAPRYFYEMFRTHGQWGDLDSTVHEMYLVGIPELYNRDTAEVDVRSEVLTRYLKDLLMNRLNILCLLDRDAKGAIKCYPKFIENIVKAWCPGPGKPEYSIIQKNYLNRICLSRRELIREIRRSLEDGIVTSNDTWQMKLEHAICESYIDARNNSCVRAAELKKEFGDNEGALSAKIIVKAVPKAE